MKGYLLDGIFAKFGLSARELYYEESDQRIYMQFSAGNDLYLAVMLKHGKQVSIYKLDKAVVLDD